MQLTADGSTEPIEHFGGPLFVQVSNSLGGGTLAVELDIGKGFQSEFVFDSVGSQWLDFPAGVVRFTLSDSTTPTTDIATR